MLRVQCLHSCYETPQQSHLYSSTSIKHLPNLPGASHSPTDGRREPDRVEAVRVKACFSLLRKYDMISIFANDLHFCDILNTSHLLIKQWLDNKSNDYCDSWTDWNSEHLSGLAQLLILIGQSLWSVWVAELPGGSSWLPWFMDICWIGSKLVALGSWFWASSKHQFVFTSTLQLWQWFIIWSWRIAGEQTMDDAQLMANNDAICLLTVAENY